MQQVTEQVDDEYLKQATPRPIAPPLVFNIVSEYIAAQPLRFFLTPWLISGMLALLALFILRASPALRLLPALIVIVQMVVTSRRVWRSVRDDIRLLRDGVILRAHVMGLRPHRSTTGQIEGALLDCAVAISPRRTHMGSVWISKEEDARRLEQLGRIRVLCLTRTPGTWRMLEPVDCEVRYDRLGPMQTIPREDEKLEVAREA